MNHTPFLSTALAGLLAAGPLSATIVAPTYVPADSTPDTFDVASPDRLVDNSGMIVPVVSGTSLADALAATHIFDGNYQQSWVTQGVAGDYFASKPNPVLVFDLGQDLEVTDLLFWQYQNNGGNGTSIGNWAKDIEIRFNTEAEGSTTFTGVPADVVLLNYAALGGINQGQQTTLETPVMARYLQLTFTDNYFGEPGITGGGDRCGLGEFRVNVVADPEIVVPAIIDITGNGSARQITVPISNNGANQTLTIASVEPAGFDGANFTVDSFPDSLAPGASGDIVLNFDPGGIAGAFDAELVITSNDIFASPNTIPIGGSVREPWIGTAESVDLGSILPDAGLQTFTIDVNNLAAFEDLTVSDAIFVTGTSFLVEDDLFVTPLVVAPGATGVINLSFDSAGQAGVFTGTLQITSDDPAEGVRSVAFTIEVLREPEISVPPVVNLGPFPNGSGSQSFTITVANLGATTDLNILTEPVIYGDAADNFTLTSYDTPIAAGASGELNLTFDPMGKSGSFVASMEIETNDPGVPYTTLTIIANVDPAAAPGGLVAWWSLDDDAAPGKDDTGNGFDGLEVGVPTKTAGANPNTGDALVFDGFSVISVPWSSYLNPASFTVTLWANPTTTAGFNSPITSRDDVAGGSASTNGYVLYNDSAGVWAFWTGDGNPGWHVVPGTAVTINTWTHLAISYDAATETKSIYVDGVLAGSATAPPALYVPNGPEFEGLHIGGGADDGSQFRFNGALDDVAVFSTALSPADIMTVMNNGVAGFLNAAPAPMELVVGGYSAGNLSLTINNIPAGETFHLRGSTDGQSFAPLAAPIDFDSTTAQPILVPGSEPLLLLRAYSGPSAPGE